MDIVSEEKCIYCNKSSEFTEEHVFPAGMGGDDRNFLLKKGVCSNCNTKVFSAFEATLMRRSVLGLARAINQPKSRNGKTSTYDPMDTVVIDEDGRQLQSRYAEGLKAEILPQLIYNGETIDAAAQNTNELEIFINELSSILEENTIFLIEKKSHKSKTKFSVSRYHLSGFRFEARGKFGVDRPPKKCLWFQYQPSKPQNTNTKPKIYRRAKGQLVVKTSDLSKLGAMLFKIRMTLPFILKNNTNVEEEAHSTPLISTTSLGWSTDCDRAIAKLGINFLAFQEGLDAARNPSLNHIKNFILHGAPFHQAAFITDQETRSEAFGTIPDGHHCVALSLCKNPDGTLTANISMILYNSTGLSVNLCYNGTSPAHLSTTYYLIDYLKNTITQHSLLEYHKLYNPSLIAKFSHDHLGKFPFDAPHTTQSNFRFN